MSTELYQRMIEQSPTCAGGAELAHRVWDGTPWMVNIYTGSHPDPRDRDILEWCYEEFGEQANPFGPEPQPGRWRRGSATIHGWTWYGFASQEDMEKFVAAWPTPEGVQPCS